MMALVPSASSVVALMRKRPSLILNGICADFTDSAPDDSAGSTICRNFVSSVACPLSPARMATSKARGLSPAMLADCSVSVPLPDNAPVSADKLRPWLESAICIEVRPVGITRPR